MTESNYSAVIGQLKTFNSRSGNIAFLTSKQGVFDFKMKFFFGDQLLTVVSNAWRLNLASGRCLSRRQSGISVRSPSTYSWVFFAISKDLRIPKICSLHYLLYFSREWTLRVFPALQTSLGLNYRGIFISSHSNYSSYFLLTFPLCFDFSC